MNPLAIAFEFVKRALDFAAAHPQDVDIAHRLLEHAMNSKAPGDVLRAAEAAAAREAIRLP